MKLSTVTLQKLAIVQAGAAAVALTVAVTRDSPPRAESAGASAIEMGGGGTLLVPPSSFLQPESQPFEVVAPFSVSIPSPAIQVPEVSALFSPAATLPLPGYKAPQPMQPTGRDPTPPRIDKSKCMFCGLG